MIQHVAVVNAGGWGTALAVLLANRGMDVKLWCRRPELADEITSTRENKMYLPGIAIPPSVDASADLTRVVPGARALLLTPISRAMRTTARAVAPLLDEGTLVAHASKGIEYPTLLRLSQVLLEELPTQAHSRVAVLSGPTHAGEVAREFPSAAVIASSDLTTATELQSLLGGTSFRVYRSADVIGVELCGALKNVVALATGGSDGMGLGDNTRAALMTRALAEIGRLVEAAGGNPRTVSGLAGLGDVVATCASRHSRNRWAGEQLGRGRRVDEIIASTRQVVEGFEATRAAVELAARLGVAVPVCQEVFRVVYQEAPVSEAVRHLMGREPAAE